MALDKGTGRPPQTKRKRPPRDTRTVTDVRREVEPISYEDARSTVAAVRAARAQAPQTQTVRPSRGPSPTQVRSSPAYPGEKPAGFYPSTDWSYGQTGPKPTPYYQFKPGQEKSAREVQGDALMKALKPQLDQAPKLAKGVRVAERVGEAFLPLSVLAKAEGRDVGAGLLAADALFSIPWLRGGRAAKKGVAAVTEVAEKAARPAGAAKIVESLPEAKKLRRTQEAGYSAERRTRIANATAAADEAGGGEAGLRAAKAELKGELPKLSFGSLTKQFGEADSELRAVLQPQVDEMLDFIADHPSMRGRKFSVIGAQEALTKALNGGVPTRGEIKTLETIFGEEAAATFKWMRAKDAFTKALNLPRSMKSTMDISFQFRQGLVMSAMLPRVWADSWGPMLKAFKNPKVARAALDEIDAMPTRPLMESSGLKLTKFGSDVTTRDEAFISDWAEKIPGFGIGARASNRAFTVAGNYQRAHAFNTLYEQALNDTGGIFASVFRKSSPGLDELSAVKQKELLDAISSLINAGTGRGNMGFDMLERAAPLLTTGLFSPRLIAARVALLNPYYYYKLPPFARKHAAKAMLRLVGAGTLVLYLAKQAGAEVNDDPRNADFGKIKVGNTRVDIWGGFQQYVVNGYRIAVEESVASTTGEVKKLEGGFGKQSRFDIAEDFLIGKAAPVPAFGIASWKGKDGTGEEFNEVDNLPEMFTPFIVSGTRDAYKEEGIPAAVAAGGLGAIGFGTQTYSAKPPKAAVKDRKEGLAQITQMLKRGEISEADAAELRGMVEDAYQQKVEEAKLPKAKAELRQTVQGALEAGIPREELNDLLVGAGKKPISEEEWAALERDLLKLDVEVGK